MSDVHNDLSSPALLCSYRLMPMASLMESIHFIFGLPVCQLPSNFPTIIVFSKEYCPLMMCLKQDGSSFVIFASRDVSGLVCSETHSFIFLAIQGIQRDLFQNRISNESFFKSAFLTVQLSSAHINWGYEDVDDLSLGLK